MFTNDEKVNKYIISIIWGIGIATLFRKVCNNNCLVVKAPKMNNYIEMKGDTCYEFVKEEVPCKKIDN